MQCVAWVCAQKVLGDSYGMKEAPTCPRLTLLGEVANWVEAGTLGVEERLESGCCKSVSSSSLREKLKQDPRHLVPPTPVRTGNHLNIGPLGIGSASWVCPLHGALYNDCAKGPLPEEKGSEEIIATTMQTHGKMWGECVRCEKAECKIIYGAVGACAGDIWEKESRAHEHSTHVRGW